jgi:hypothetical protein
MKAQMLKTANGLVLYLKSVSTVDQIWLDKWVEGDRKVSVDRVFDVGEIDILSFTEYPKEKL